MMPSQPKLYFFTGIKWTIYTSEVALFKDVESFQMLTSQPSMQKSQNNIFLQICSVIYHYACFSLSIF